MKKLLILLLFLSAYQTLEAGRYYSSDQGRFIQRDSLGFVDGMSLYNAYFAERFELDPSGHETIPEGRTAPNQTSKEYFEDWKKRNPDRDKSKDTSRFYTLQHGCIGITCIELEIDLTKYGSEKKLTVTKQKMQPRSERKA